ncbi:hypothetical protein [Microlunatus speluncae]|uniref:hypothetical protein n=1 Tax=Microlunatus speluncae TaxID=2594267 RepID=UPI0012664601|nr:hypothetical protein [Microlunatus speluncae]
MIDGPLRRTMITVVTYGLLGVAFVLGVVWFFWPENTRWEPAVNSLTLVAGLTGIFVDRLTREAERRREVVAAVIDELRENERVLSDERFTGSGRRRQIYPRLVVSAVDVALVSGVLVGHRDTDLVTQLHRWRDTVHELNRRLDLTEFRTFSESVTDEELDGFQRALQGENSFLITTRERLTQLTARLAPLRPV